MNCDQKSLIQAASCNRCIPRGSQQGVMIYLLCQWLKKKLTHLLLQWFAPGMQRIMQLLSDRLTIFHSTPSLTPLPQYLDSLNLTWYGDRSWHIGMETDLLSMWISSTQERISPSVVGLSVFWGLPLLIMGVVMQRCSLLCQERKHLHSCLLDSAHEL